MKQKYKYLHASNVLRMNSPVNISERDRSLLQWREKVAFDPDQAGADELFQGDVLRPILKFQNDFLLRRFALEQKKAGIINGNETPTDLRRKVSDIIRMNPAMRGEFLGCVTGLMTSEELEFYSLRQKEITKRIISLIEERLVSQKEVWL